LHFIVGEDGDLAFPDGNELGMLHFNGTPIVQRGAA